MEPAPTKTCIPSPKNNNNYHQPNAQSLANLKKIEAKIGEQLQQLPIENIMQYSSRYCYSCDEAGDVTGLNLRDSKIKDISFLTDFPRLTYLSLSCKQVADLSPLMALTQLTWLNLENPGRRPLLLISWKSVQKNNLFCNRQVKEGYPGAPLSAPEDVP